MSPPNDNIANAIKLSELTGSINGTLDGATSEPNDPGDTRSVWYTYTPPAPGELVLSLYNKCEAMVINMYCLPKGAVPGIGPQLDRVFIGNGNAGLSSYPFFGNNQFTLSAGTTPTVIRLSSVSARDMPAGETILIQDFFNASHYQFMTLTAPVARGDISITVDSAPLLYTFNGLGQCGIYDIVPPHPVDGNYYTVAACSSPDRTFAIEISGHDPSDEPYDFTLFWRFVPITDPVAVGEPPETYTGKAMFFYIEDYWGDVTNGTMHYLLCWTEAHGVFPYIDFGFYNADPTGEGGDYSGGDNPGTFYLGATVPPPQAPLFLNYPSWSQDGRLHNYRYLIPSNTQLNSAVKSGIMRNYQQSGPTYDHEFTGPTIQGGVFHEPSSTWLVLGFGPELFGAGDTLPNGLNYQVLTQWDATCTTLLDFALVTDLGVRNGSAGHVFILPDGSIWMDGQTIGGRAPCILPITLGPLTGNPSGGALTPSQHLIQNRGMNLLFDGLPSGYPNPSSWRSGLTEYEVTGGTLTPVNYYGHHEEFQDMHFDDGNTASYRGGRYWYFPDFDPDHVWISIDYTYGASEGPNHNHSTSVRAYMRWHYTDDGDNPDTKVPDFYIYPAPPADGVLLDPSPFSPFSYRSSFDLWAGPGWANFTRLSTPTVRSLSRSLGTAVSNPPRSRISNGRAVMSDNTAITVAR